jgi:hypothetical protein
MGDRLNKQKIELIGENIDRLISLDIAGRGFINTLYPPTRERHGSPLCLMAAEKLQQNVAPGDFVLIACGMLVYPLELAETDGPLGGAALARALQIGLGARPVLVTDYAAIDMTKAVCTGANLNVCDLQKLKATARTVSVIGFPVDENKATIEAERLFSDLNPKAIISVECRGRNEKGVYHAIPKGRNMNHIAAKTVSLFDKAKDVATLTVGIGDGGNEIGWGIVNDIIREKVPYGDKCSCGCGGGFGDVTKVDVLVAASVSNWGAYGVTACLSLLLNNPEVCHNAEIESRMLRLCIDSGGINGPSFLPEPKVDGLSEEANRSVVTILEEMTRVEFAYPDFATK